MELAVAHGELEYPFEAEETPAAAAPEAREAEAPAPALTVQELLWGLLAAACWGTAQWWLVAHIVGREGWAHLPYDTVMEVGVWLFLATSASAWLILCYAIHRFRRPILWFWWGACAAWWIMLFLPYRASHAAFGQKLHASETAGLRLVKRVQAYQRERGRLPGQLREVELRDGQPLPATRFGTPFEYRKQDLKHFELAIRAGDKTYRFNSASPRAGFRLGYFD